MTIKKGDLLGQALGIGPIVAIQEREIFPACMGNGAIPCDRNATILFVANETDAGIAVGADNCDTAVGGPIINDSSSKSANVCARMLSIASGRYFSRLYTGIATLTLGDIFTCSC